MIPSTRILFKASKSVCHRVTGLNPLGIRTEFAALMDQCANTVTMEHGLDLDDVLMERFARVGEQGDPAGNWAEVAIPFLTDPPSLIQTLVQGWREDAGAMPMPSPDHLTPQDRLEIRELVVRVYLEMDPPLFNQAGKGAH